MERIATSGRKAGHVLCLGIAVQILFGCAHAEAAAGVAGLEGRWEVTSKGRFGSLEFEGASYRFSPDGAWVRDPDLGGQPFFFVKQPTGTVDCAADGEQWSCRVDSGDRFLLERESDCVWVIESEEDALPWVRLSRCE